MWKIRSKRLPSIIIMAWFGLLVVFVTVSRAAEGENYLMSSVSNSAWILNKASRKMVFVQYQEDDVLWKSEVVALPESLSLERCRFEATGARGTALFVMDRTTGSVMFFEVLKDRRIRKYADFDAAPVLK